MKTNILVTGGAGFIGSALVRELLTDKNNQVIVYDTLELGSIKYLPPKGKWSLVQGDILDTKLLDEIIKRYKIREVYHLAARPFIPEGYVMPRKMIEVNTIGTLNVMLACLKHQVAKVMHYSTSEVYGTAQYIPMDEEHPTIPHSMYAVAKLGADRLCHVLYKEKGLPVIILRQFNCYGPRETHPYIIPEVIAQLSKSNELNLGNITARRDFTYVDDAVKGEIMIMKSNAFGEVFNIGSNVAYTMQELVYMIADIMGKNVTIIRDMKRYRPYDVMHLQTRYDKMHKITGWNPTTDIMTGLAKTVKWYEKNKAWSWEWKRNA